MYGMLMANVDDSFPYHSKALDFETLMKEFPPAPAFGATVARLSADALRDLQDKRFLSVMASAWHIPFYLRRWRAVGIEPGDIRSIDDLPLLPAFTIHDLRDSIERKPPFGDYMAVSQSDTANYPLTLVTSGGTTGMPRPMLYAAREREIMTILRSRSLHMHGVRPGDLVQVTMALGLSNGGLGTRDALQRYNGAIAISTGSGNSTPSRRQIELAQSIGSQVFLGFPAYLRHLGRVAQDELSINPQSLKIKVISSHLGTEERGTLEQMWGCRCFDSYGCHEVGHVASECEQADGMHLFEDAVITEFVDTTNGAPVPQGQPGSMVLTSLYRHDVPFIRYNINDVAALRGGTCACGSTLKRISPILGRGDLMVKLRGVNVFPEAVGAVVGADLRCNGEFFCVVNRVGLDGHDDMVVSVEINPSSNAASVVAALETRLKEVIGVKVSVQTKGVGELAHLTGITTTSKPKRLVDQRK